MKKILFILLIFSISINSQQLNRVYILSEGGFGAGLSKLSMLDVRNNEFTQSIFNPGDIGLYPDGLVLFDKNIYLTEQGSFGSSGKIYKLDSAGTVLNSSVVGTNPYSLAISYNKIYITNGPAGNVSVLNINDFSLVKDVKVGAYPQEIIANENYVFVANNSQWGGDSDSTVSVISAETDEVVNTIIVKLNPSSLAFTDDNHLLIGCPGDSASGMIFKVNLDDFSKVDSFAIAKYGFGKDITVDNENSKIYFKGFSNDIIEFDLINRNAVKAVDAQSVMFTYGYGYDKINDVHYVLDAKDFSVNGSLTTYNSEGTLLNTYETGIAPRRLLFDYAELTTNVENNSISTTFKLRQNYPNPFNPSTVISFQIPEPGNVRIIVYDALGREIKTLVDETKSAGSYNIIFDGSNLSSGIYFYTMKVNDFIASKKMLLAK